MWLHLGLLGPRRVLSGDVDAPQPPPYRLVDNAETLLAHSDLVFIDPVSTGYSRAVTGEIHHVDAGYHILGMKHPDAPDITVAKDD